MATPHACAALVDVFPRLLRARRHLAGTTTTPPLVMLAVIHEQGPLRVSEVAERLSLDLSTVSRQVTHLRQKGLLESTPDPDDGRSQHVAITSAGIGELRSHRRAVVDKLVDRLGDWDDAEIADLTRLLDKLGRDTCVPADPQSPTSPGTFPPPTPQPQQTPQPHETLQRNA